ncbi:phage portal protein [Azospirillum sp. TSO22-1]|uniref:phage portal protein n=1 Tax=Azospirillum sp. TSO22-1 TaxID=716789 RepID=UPI000D6443BF|nr:phage portal protein [Azospirillum sp. TSO22-1]
MWKLGKGKKGAVEQRSESYDLTDPYVAFILGGMGPTVAGENVTPDSALRCSAAFACIRIVGETLAQLTPHLYRKKGDDDRERATDHPAYKLVAKAANPWTPASEFRLIVGTHFASVGNGYAFIGRDGGGRPAELIPLDARLVAVKQDPLTLEPIYTVTTPDGQTRDYSRADIFHVRGVGLDVYKGASTVSLAREAIGLALTLEKHCAGLFGRGAKPSGILKHAKTMSDKVFARISGSFSKWYTGGANAGKTMILEDGTEFQQLQLSSVDSQTLEMRRFQIAEISRYWRIPLHMLNDLERATHNNAEAMGQQFLTFCILPILKLWCDALAISLLTEDERETHYFEFLVDDLARAEILKRFEAYGKAIDSGVLNPNEARAMENRPGYEGGEVYGRSLNYTPASDFNNASDPSRTDAAGGDA